MAESKGPLVFRGRVLAARAGAGDSAPAMPAIVDLTSLRPLRTRSRMSFLKRVSLGRLVQAAPARGSFHLTSPAPADGSATGTPAEGFR